LFLIRKYRYQTPAVKTAPRTVPSDKTKKVSEIAPAQHRSGGAELTPCGQRGGTSIHEIPAADEGAFLIDPKGREAKWLWI
jgi:hypothetical protein